MVFRTLFLGLSVALTVAAPGLAQQTGLVRSERPGLSAGLDANAAYGTTANAIVGEARGPDRAPLPEGRLQLRSLRAGEVVRRLLADGDGRFAFRSVEPGTYVVELMGADDTVLALSEAVTIGANEVIETLVQSTDRTRTFGWWLGSTTSSALSSAASLGILSVEPGAPASPVS